MKKKTKNKNKNKNDKIKCCCLFKVIILEKLVSSAYRS